MSAPPKRCHPRPTRRRPPRGGASKKSAPLKLSKAGARGLRESISKNRPKTSEYYHIPRDRRARASDMVFALCLFALVLGCIWGLAAAHDVGFQTGRGAGWEDGYAAGIEAAQRGPGL